MTIQCYANAMVKLCYFYNNADAILMLFSANAITNATVNGEVVRCDIM